MIKWIYYASVFARSANISSAERISNLPKDKYIERGAHIDNKAYSISNAHEFEEFMIYDKKLREG